jgi:pimeloyl-ACP methyl ester carboxylesterase
MSAVYSVRSSGYDLAVEEIGQGPAVIYAHGLGSNRQDTLAQWESVSHDFRVIGFDQRGHGQSSPVVQPQDYDPWAMGEDIGAILDHLGIHQAIVGGVSMGACTALCFALSHPKKVKALLQTGPAVDETIHPGLQSLVVTGDLFEQLGIEGAISTTSREWKGLGMPPESIAEMATRYRRYHCASMVTAYHSIPAWTIPFSPLRRLDLPVKILTWENDPVHDIQIARRMAQFLPQADLLVIPGVFTPNIGEIYRDEFLHSLPD